MAPDQPIEIDEDEVFILSLERLHELTDQDWNDLRERSKQIFDHCPAGIGEGDIFKSIVVAFVEHITQADDHWVN